MSPIGSCPRGPLFIGTLNDAVGWQWNETLLQDKVIEKTKGTIDSRLMYL